MARRPRGEGQVVPRKSKDGVTYGLRFRAYGKRHYITSAATSREEAERELRHVLADVERGIWKPPTRGVAPAQAQEQTFHEFASEWLRNREAEGLAERTIADLKWSLELHLLPYFADFPLPAITAQDVDRYKVAKVQERDAIEAVRAEAEARGQRYRERALSNGSINHTLSDLAQVLETAVDYKLIRENPATGKRRRLTTKEPAGEWVQPEQLMVLLDAPEPGVRRVLLRILAGTGLRIGEALALRWRHVDLMGAGTLSVVASKTDAGVRTVDLPAALRDELQAWWRETRFAGPDDLVLPTSTGRRQSESNLRRDVLTPAIAKANAVLQRDAIVPIGPITFHSLRKTYASMRFACGDDIVYVAAQGGWKDVRTLMKVYAKATKRRGRLSGPHLRAFDRAIEWAQMGTNDERERVLATAEATKNPA
jgi:integrase